jgi:hypothetical protein
MNGYGYGYGQRRHNIGLQPTAAGVIVSRRG